VRTLNHQADSIRLSRSALRNNFPSPGGHDLNLPSSSTSRNPHGLLQTPKHKHAPRLFLSHLKTYSLQSWCGGGARRCAAAGQSNPWWLAKSMHRSIVVTECTKMKRSFVTLGRSPLLLALNCDRRAQQARQPPASRGTTIYTLTAARSHTCTQHLAKVSLVLRLASRGEANKSGQTASYYSACNSRLGCAPSICFLGIYFLRLFV
jgi:hypothetical protein